MKKILYLFLILISSECFANGPFLQLCKIFYEENLEIKAVEDSIKLARLNKNEAYSLLIPEISIAGGIDYSQNDFEKEYPDYGKLSANINQYLFWGANLSLSGSFYYSKILEDEKKQYEPGAQVYAVYTQSLAPYFLSFGQRNPDFYIGKLNYLIQLENKKNVVFTQIQYFLQLYLNYKKLIKNLEIQNKYLILCEESYLAEKQILNNNSGSLLNLYEKHQKLINVSNNLLSLEKQKEKTINQFEKLLNHKIDEELLELILNESLQADWEKDFISYFDFWNIDLALKAGENIEEYEIEKEKNLYVLKRQTYAPKLKVIADCSYSVSDKHNLEVSVELDFSTLFSPENLNLKREYKITKKNEVEKVFQTKQENIKLREENEHALAILLENQKQLENEYEFIKRLYADYKEVYNKGNCSKLDFLSMEINYLQTQQEMEDLKNQILYYSILLNVEISE